MNKVLEVTGLEGGYGSVQILYGIDPVSYTHLTLPTILRV